MSRPRTATAILDARGAFKKHPERKRTDPKVSDPFPETAPETLTPLQVKWWHRVREMIPKGVLTGADQLTVRVCACLAAEYERSPDDMPTARIAQMRGFMGELGLSPSARAKLATKPEDDDGEF